MANDPQTFQRGAQAAIIGLVIQLVLTIAMALLGLWARSPAIQIATWYLLGGLPVWIILFLVFNQQKLERIESLEAQQEANKPAAAMFDERADDLDLARRRLARLNKWGMGLTSIVLSVFLLVVGLIYFYLNYRQLDRPVLSESTLVVTALGAQVKPLLLMFISAAIAMVAFVMARYVAGMTRDQAWVPLRGGASYLMGTSLVSILITIASVFVAGMGSTIMMGLLALVIPGIMILIGLEIALSFMLSAYRPRRPGEVPRAAFDSRMLGILTSPDSLGRVISETLNYQFGFEISRSWFYQLLGRAIAPLVLISIIVLMSLSSVVVVQPFQEAIITFGGSVTRVVGPGPHLKWFWPLGGAQKFPVGRIEQVNVGSMLSKTGPEVAILWTNEHTQGKEDYLLTPTESEHAQIEAQVEDDLNLAAQVSGTSAATPEAVLVAAEVMVQYKIKDLKQYALSSADVPSLLKAMANDVVMSYFANHPMGELLTSGRDQAGRDMRQIIQTKTDNQQMGIDVVFVGITGIHPPKDGGVAQAYHEQIGALQEKQGSIQDAFKKASQILAEAVGTPQDARNIDAALSKRRLLKVELDQHKIKGADKIAAAQQQLQEEEANIESMLAKARGQAAQIIYKARAYRLSRAITEQGKAERFDAQLAAYKQAPEYYMMRQYLDTLATGVAPARKIVITGNVEAPSLIRIDLKDSQTAMGKLFTN